MSKALVAPEAEVAVLGACLIDAEAILTARKIVSPESFVVARHRVVFRAMLRAVDAGRAIDPVTLAEDLSARGELEDAGGLEYLAELLDAVPSAAHLEHHAGILADRAARRRLEAVGRRIATDATNPDLDIGEIRALIGLHVEEVANLEGIDGLPAATAIGDLPPPEPVPWAVRGLLLAGDINLMVSDPGIGKTTVATHIAGAKAMGCPVVDHWPFRTTAGPVLIVSEEDPADIIRNRLYALAAGHGWDRESVARRVHVLAQAGVSLSDPEWQAHIRAEAVRTGAELVIFDPYAELVDGEENSNDAAKGVIRYLRHLAVETGAAVLVVHHLGKAAEGKRKIDRIRGASALYAAARSVLILEADQLGIRAEVVKFNRGAPPPSFVIERTVHAYPDNPGVWESARLEYVSLQEAEVIEHNATIERLRPAVVEFLERNPGCTKRQLREGVKGARTQDVLDTFDALVREGVARYDAPARNGQSGKCWLTEAPVPTGSRPVPGTGSGAVPARGHTPPLGGVPTGNRPPHGTPEQVKGPEPVYSEFRLTPESPDPHPADAILNLDEEVA